VVRAASAHRGSALQLVLLAAALAGGCRGNQPLYEMPVQRERRHLETVRPDPIEPRGGFAGPVVTVPVWVYADEGHRRQVQGWVPRFQAQVEAANPMLEACCGLRLEVERARAWKDDQSADVARALEALRGHAPLTESRLVVGLLAPMTFDATDFRVLGMAEEGGRHFVMRGLDDAVLARVIDQVAPNAGLEARQELYRLVTRHKEQAILLHELGHILGAPHVSDAQAIMNGQYDWSMRGFSAGTLRVLASNRDQLTPSGVAEAMARSGRAEAADALIAAELAERPDDPALRLRRCSVRTSAMDEIDAPTDEAWASTLEICRAALDANAHPFAPWAAGRAAAALERWDEAHALADEATARREGLAAASRALDAPLAGTGAPGATPAAPERVAEEGDAWWAALAGLRAQLGELSAARAAQARAGAAAHADLDRWLEQTSEAHPGVAEADLDDWDQGRLYRAVSSLREDVGERPARALIARADRIYAEFDGSGAGYRWLCRAWSGGGPDPTTMCRKALASRPDDGDVLFWWAQADLRKRRLSGAVRRLRRLRRVDPKHEEGARLLQALEGAMR
jgi:tetratricopeptide (TPR) repeat protein